jgi:hypothetical protein
MPASQPILQSMLGPANGSRRAPHDQFNEGVRGNDMPLIQQHFCLHVGNIANMALVVARKCILRYDNEAGKGDHRHVGSKEFVYQFQSYEQLLTDFWADVEAWRQRQ